MDETFLKVPVEIELLAKQTVDAALRVHKKLGPGLLESVYEKCLAYELEKKGLRVERQLILPILYEDLIIEGALRIDLIVEGELIVEVKAVDEMKPVFKAQVLTYLRLTGKRRGLLINFNVLLIKDGIQRVIN